MCFFFYVSLSSMFDYSDSEMLMCFQVWKLGINVVRQFSRQFRPLIDSLVTQEWLGLLQRCGSMTIFTLHFTSFIYLDDVFYLLTKHTDVHWLSAAPGSYQEGSFPRKKEKRSSAGCHDSREVLM